MPPRRLSERVGFVLKDVAIVAGARAVLRRLPINGVIVTNQTLDPFLACAVAGIGGNWLFYQFLPPGPSAWSSDPSRALATVARVAQMRRQRLGGRARIAVSTESQYESWIRAAPWLNPVRVPFIAARARMSIPNARERLGLPRHIPVALLFGAAHDRKDYEVVWRAFRELPDWCLTVAGPGSSDHYRAWANQHGVIERQPILFDGFVDEEMRDLLHAAADLVVLSFKENKMAADSGTLVDSIAWGLPMVCSDRSFAGTQVKRLKLGTIFEPGDAASLTAAVRAAPRSLDASVLDRARDEFSAARMAALHLAALGLSDCSAGGSRTSC
jgi:glycosyltransferase involved in cell wall biosynthesis